MRIRMQCKVNQNPYYICMDWKYKCICETFFKIHTLKQMGKSLYVCRIDKICLPECKMSLNEDPKMPRSVRIMESNLNLKYASQMYCFLMEHICVWAYICAIVSLDFLLNYDKTMALCGNAQNNICMMRLCCCDFQQPQTNAYEN